MNNVQGLKDAKAKENLCLQVTITMQHVLQVCVRYAFPGLTYSSWLRGQG